MLETEKLEWQMRYDEADKLIGGLRGQVRRLESLLHYLESRGYVTAVDLDYCRGTLRRVAKDLIATSRGPLVSFAL